MNILRQAYIRYDNNHYVFEILDRGNNVHIKCVHHSSYLYVYIIYIFTYLDKYKGSIFNNGQTKGKQGSRGGQISEKGRWARQKCSSGSKYNYNVK